MPDHVHLLIDCDPQLGIHRVVKRLKGRVKPFRLAVKPASASRRSTLRPQLPLFPKL